VDNMVDDLQSGTRDDRGDWKPSARLELPPYLRWPLNPIAILKWLPGYLFPWNAFHMATALAYWYLVIPDVEVMQTIRWDWAVRLYAINAAAIFVMYGSIEFLFYVRRKQGTQFKYSGRFPADRPSDAFWFKSQNIDNALRTFLISIPLWTLVQVLFLWCFATGAVPWLLWADHPVYLAVLAFFAPMLHEVHFFVIHRLIHVPLLYKWVHAVHHKSVNPTPWSSLSMHPVESFIYHAVAFWHLVIPSNPILALFQLHLAGFGAINGHIGFDHLELGGRFKLKSHAYAHYLHHKLFEVNYGGDGLIPLDKWLGSWHDGSPEGEALMKARLRRKRERAEAKRQAAL
jgi:sterol desaturase/sphingolipid hydroxylase (fatty acid hydroxylase superfamily)